MYCQQNTILKSVPKKPRISGHNQKLLGEPVVPSYAPDRSDKCITCIPTNQEGKNTRAMYVSCILPDIQGKGVALQVTRLVQVNLQTRDVTPACALCHSPLIERCINCGSYYNVPSV